MCRDIRWSKCDSTFLSTRFPRCVSVLILRFSSPLGFPRRFSVLVTRLSLVLSSFDLLLKSPSVFPCSLSCCLVYFKLDETSLSDSHWFVTASWIVHPLRRFRIVRHQCLSETGHPLWRPLHRLYFPLLPIISLNLRSHSVSLRLCLFIVGVCHENPLLHGRARFSCRIFWFPTRHGQFDYVGVKCSPLFVVNVLLLETRVFLTCVPSFSFWL